MHIKSLIKLCNSFDTRAPLADTIAMWTEIQESGDMDLLKSAMNKLTLHPFKATQEEHISHLAVMVGIHRERSLPCRCLITTSCHLPSTTVAVAVLQHVYC